MATARKIISDSYSYAMITNDPDGRQAMTGLDGLNSVLNLLNVDSFFNFNIQQVEFTPASDTVTIGTGQAVDIERPMAIDSCYVQEGSGWCLLDQVAPQDLLQYKDGSNSLPIVFSYNGGYPNGTLSFNSTPSGNVRIFVRPSFGAYDLDDEVAIPMEYLVPIRWALASHLAFRFGIESAPQIEQVKNEHIDRIRANVHKSRPITSIMKSGNRPTFRNMDFTGC